MRLGSSEPRWSGFSAGTVSAMQFGLRHPDRITALVVMSGHYPQKHHKLPERPLRLLYSDRVFWTLKTFAPKLFARVGGTPKGFRASSAEQRALEWVMEGLFPIKPRTRGAIFDTLVSEPDVDSFPLEQMSVPTLMIHAADDALARYATVPPAAARIPGARLVTIERGGHLYLVPKRACAGKSPDSSAHTPPGGAPRTMTGAAVGTPLKRGLGRPPSRHPAPSRPGGPHGPGRRARSPAPARGAIAAPARSPRPP